jgi:hypothetical protein
VTYPLALSVYGTASILYAVAQRGEFFNNFKRLLILKMTGECTVLCVSLNDKIMYLLE